VVAKPEVDVVISSFTSEVPGLAIRPCAHHEHDWQVVFDTNIAIREVLGEGTFPAPMPVFGVQHLNQLGRG